MHLKTYTTVRLVTVFFLAMACGIAGSTQNYFWAIPAIIVATLFLFFIRGKVKEIIADERDYEIGGKAARFAIQIYSWIAVVAMFILLAQKNLNPSYEPIAYTLAYSTCLLLITYSIVFRYYAKYSMCNKKSVYIILGIIAFLIILVIGLRLFSGEDNWICSNGQWIKHGHPSFPQPTVECK